jgi:hypothetical protein
MALVSTQPLTELSTRNLRLGQRVTDVLLATSPPPVILLPTKCGSLDVSLPYGPPRPLTGIALFLFQISPGNESTGGSPRSQTNARRSALMRGWTVL